MWSLEVTSRTDPHSLGFLLTDISRLLRAEFERRITRAGLGLTPGEARTILRIDAFPTQRQTTLAERMTIEPMTLCRYLDRLEAANLVSRQPDPDDRRAKVVVLTDEGREMVGRIVEHTGEMLRDIQSGLEADEREALKKALLTVQANLTEPENQTAAANG